MVSTGIQPNSNPRKRYWNPLRPQGRGRSWSQDALASICMIQARIDLIRAREGIAQQGRDASAVDQKGPERWPGGRLFGRATVGPAVMQALRPERPSSSRHQRQCEVREICKHAENCLMQAKAAATGEQPAYLPVISWWLGTCTEAAFKNIHNAEAAIARLYTPAEIRAELPEAARRAREALSRDDPLRQITQNLLQSGECSRGHPNCSPEMISKIIEVGHTAADRQRSRLRTFRNVLIIGIVVTTILLAAFVVLAAYRPSLVPVCFEQDPAPPDPQPNVICPTRAELDTVSADLSTGDGRRRRLAMQMIEQPQLRSRAPDGHGAGGARRHGGYRAAHRSSTFWRRRGSRVACGLVVNDAVIECPPPGGSPDRRATTYCRLTGQSRSLAPGSRTLIRGSGFDPPGPTHAE
jgi:hypothetical protein